MTGLIMFLIGNLLACAILIKGIRDSDREAEPLLREYWKARNRRLANKRRIEESRKS